MGGLQKFSITKNSRMSRFYDRSNMPPDRLWDIQNAYIDKENNIQQRNGITKYNYNEVAIAISLGTCTVSIATPAVISLTAHGLVVGDTFKVTTTGALPTGMTAGSTYYVINAGFGANSFQFSATSGGSAINTSGSQSGTHTLSYLPIVRSLYELRTSSGLKRMVCRAGTSWFKEDGDAVWDSLAGATGRTKDAQGDIVMSQDAVGDDMFIIVDAGVPLMANISATGVFAVNPLGGTPPIAPTTIHSHNGHIIMNNTTLTPRVVTILYGAGTEITLTAHRFRAGDAFTVTTTGALPAGMTEGTKYYVISAGLTANVFSFSATLGGSAVDTTDAGSGTHTLAYDPQESLVYVSAFRNAQDYTTAGDRLIIDLRYVLPIADHPIGFASIGEDTLVIICKNYIACYYAPEATLAWALRGIYETGGITNYATAKHRALQMIFIPGLEGVNGFLEGGQVLAKEQNPFVEIEPLYRSYLATLTSSNWKYINGGIGRNLNHYYISFPLSTGHEILVFSLDHNSIVGRYTGLTMWSFCEREDGTILIGGNAGQVYTMNSGTSDDGVAITAKISTPYYYAGNNERFKAIKILRVPVSHTADLTLYADWAWDTQAGSTVSQALTASSLGRSDFKTRNVTGRGRGIAFDIYHSSKDSIVSIAQWSAHFILQGIK